MKKPTQLLLSLAIPIAATAILTIVISFWGNVISERKAFCKCQSQEAEK